MAITEKQKKHSVVLFEILKSISNSNRYSISVEGAISGSAHIFSIFNEGVLFKKIGVFIKTSDKRRSPWRYTFIRDHQTEIDILNEDLDFSFVVFVNGDDGVACLTYEDLKQILDHDHEDAEWVSVKRPLRGQYIVSGNDGDLSKKIANSSFPGLILEKIEEAS